VHQITKSLEGKYKFGSRRKESEFRCQVSLINVFLIIFVALGDLIEHLNLNKEIDIANRTLVQVNNAFEAEKKGKACPLHTS